MYNTFCKCGFSSSGRASPCQGEGSEFESRNPLQKWKQYPKGAVFIFAERSRLEQGNPQGSNSPVDCCGARVHVGERRSEPSESRNPLQKWKQYPKGAVFIFAERSRLEQGNPQGAIYSFTLNCLPLAAYC